MKILVSGTSGLVGAALVSCLLSNGHETYKLVRARADLLSNEIPWDPHQGVFSPSLLEGFDAVIHLAGESIYGRWTDAKKKRIRQSRVIGTDVLCQQLGKLDNPPSVLITASGIGYYGNRGNEILTEISARGEDFLSGVCEEWEEATRPAAEKGIRVVFLRLGMVLSHLGGGLKKMLPIFKWGLGGPLGNGNQFMSWIALDDVLRVILYAIHRESLAGPVNVVSPFPVTNREFTKILGKVLHRPTVLTVPAFMINLIFGQMGKEVLLGSIRAKPEKLIESGFEYEYPHLEQALNKEVKLE